MGRLQFDKMEKYAHFHGRVEAFAWGMGWLLTDLGFFSYFTCDHCQYFAAEASKRVQTIGNQPVFSRYTESGATVCCAFLRGVTSLHDQSSGVKALHLSSRCMEASRGHTEWEGGDRDLVHSQARQHLVNLARGVSQ